jgi:transcriptional regulator with XRE-family HTH domain
MKLRNVLQKYLDETGLTAAALATKAKVPKTTLAGWLAGKTPRDFTQVRAVAKVTGMSLERLLFDEENPQEIKIAAASFPSISGAETEWQHAILEVKYRPVKRP